MAVRFYKELNNLSTADFLEHKETSRRGKLYEVERVIAKKMRKGKAVYLVKWVGYHSFCNTWEPECNLNLLALRSYNYPSPFSEIVSRSVDALHNAILDNLGSRGTLPTVIMFQHDVFRFLFKNMGKASGNKNHTLLEKKDFVRCAFPKDWDILIDKLGDGVKVAFPIKVRLFLSKSRKNHTLCEGQIMEKPGYYIEKLSINCQKQACTLT